MRWIFLWCVAQKYLLLPKDEMNNLSYAPVCSLMSNEGRRVGGEMMRKDTELNCAVIVSGPPTNLPTENFFMDYFARGLSNSHDERTWNGMNR